MDKIASFIWIHAAFMFSSIITQTIYPQLRDTRPDPALDTIIQNIRRIEQRQVTMGNLSQAVKNLHIELQQRSTQNLTQSIRRIEQRQNAMENLSQAVRNLELQQRSTQNLTQSIRRIEQRQDTIDNLSQAVRNVELQQRATQNLTQGIRRNKQQQDTIDNLSQAVRNIELQQRATQNLTQSIRRIEQQQDTIDNLSQAVRNLELQQRSMQNLTQGIRRIEQQKNTSDNLSQAVRNLQIQQRDTQNLIQRMEQRLGQSRECKSPWISLENSCFLFPSTKKTWSEASSHCTSVGGKLAEINTAGKNDKIRCALPSKIEGSVYWVGGTDRTYEDNWIWTSNSQSFCYTNWEPNEPNNNGGSEDCLIIVIKGSRLEWNDFPCSRNLNFICEK